MISISLPLPPTGLRAHGSPASGAPPGDFALALADMLAIPAAGPRPAPVTPGRQIDAGPGKALPVDGGIEIPIEGDAEALPLPGAALPQPPDAPAPPNNDPIDQSPDKESAHARKEAIAALPLPIPGAAPAAVPDGPRASKTADAASPAVSSSPIPAMTPASSPPALSPDAALPSDRRAPLEAAPNAARREREVSLVTADMSPSDQRATIEAPPLEREPASAMSRIAPHLPHAASTTAPITVDPSDTRPGRRPPSAPASAPVPGGADASPDPALAPAPVVTMRADAAPARPGRFAARLSRKAETIVRAEQNHAGSVDAERKPGGLDTHSNEAAAAPAQSPKPGNAAFASAPPRVEGRPAPSAAKGVATAPWPAERPVATRPAQPMTEAAHRPQPAPTKRVGIAPADGPRAEVNVADRPVPAPGAAPADAARPHRPGMVDARIAAAPAQAARNAAAPPPDRIAGNSIAPAQASPAAPTPHATPIVPPAAVPIAAIFGGPRPIDPRTPRGGEIADAPSGLSPALASTHAASSVQPPAEGRRTPLDMRRDDWTRKLIDRIETIRDAANAADTRIKLMPDALGKIDVSMRKDGDTLHVSFTADVPATRAMLADAQPRLAELAQQRGLRLGQASVDAGTSGDGQQRPAPEPSIPASPMRAAARAEAPTETGRVA